MAVIVVNTATHIDDEGKGGWTCGRRTLMGATSTPNRNDRFDFRDKVSHDSPEHFAGFADEAATRALTRARG
jgi:hypothetical protein